MDGKTPSRAAESILPVLIYIQTHLDDDLSLEMIARKVGLSPFYFHRLFQQFTGETLKKYTQRLRLERAAFELKIRDASILDVALSTGYRSHETFSRAFRRQFGLTPLSYRQTHGRLLHSESLNSDKPRKVLNRQATHFQVSAMRVQKLTSFVVAFIRHLGDYADVDPRLYDELILWTQDHGFYNGKNLLLAIGHDDPTITPTEKVRFDACIEVPRAFPPQGRIGCQEVPAGWYATLTYVGPYGPIMEAAYSAIFHGVMQLRGYRLVGLPALEIYRTTRITPDYDLNETDIYLPLEKTAES